jgi:hypothetical protein
MTAPTRFQIARLDGRSDADVIYDTVAKAEPGTVFPFDDLVRALRDTGPTDRNVTVSTVRHAVRRVYTRLLRDEARTLQNIVGVGYRIAEASAHQTIAKARQRRADVQLHRGVQVLQHVRWEEMDANTRAAHEGTLLLLSALSQQQRQLSRRQSRIETALALLSKPHAGSDTAPPLDAQALSRILL